MFERISKNCAYTTFFKYFLSFSLSRTYISSISIDEKMLSRREFSSKKYFISDIEAACKPSPCGENTQCEVINQVPVCTCLHGYRGSPLAGCRHECESDSECPQHLACSSSFRCESPCKCGENAECQVINHQAKCTCPKVRYAPTLSFDERKNLQVISRI